MEVVAGDTADLLRERERRQTPEYREQLRAEQEAQERAQLDATRAPVTFAALHGHMRELTVRAAAVEFSERFAGQIAVEDGHAVLISPPFSQRSWQPASDLRELVELLAAAGPAIVEAVNGKAGKVDPGKLPDRPLGAAGGLL